jgi:hypothetical protein
MGTNDMSAKVNSPMKISGRELVECTVDCDALIVAAGFEERALKVIDVVKNRLPRRILVARYAQRLKENENTFKRMVEIVSEQGRAAIEVIDFDPRAPDKYLANLRDFAVGLRPIMEHEVWVDISAFAMQGICATLAAVREALGPAVIRVLYTEAELYYPRKSDVEKKGEAYDALSREMSANLIPKRFAGMANETSTCLLLFAGYEKHRSVGVVDQLNPAKVVLIFGKPPREDLQWRLAWSQRLHDPIRASRPTSSEVISTLDPMEALQVLSEYYGYLFSDHNIAVTPLCSKMQAVAVYLFWERYRDVQLVFPLPVSYLPGRFSERTGAVFEWRLPSPGEVGKLVVSPLSRN